MCLPESLILTGNQFLVTRLVTGLEDSDLNWQSKH